MRHSFGSLESTNFTAAAFIQNAVASTRKVKGVLTVEVPDKTHGWIFDYDESKKYFREWFNEIHNATDGKSWGNVRLMHQMEVAGKICEEPVFDDENKLINCVVEVTTDKAWGMVENGEICAFSFSGVKVPPPPEIVNKWLGMPNGQKRYIGRPLEVSLVDNPNQVGAYFEIVNNTFTFEKPDGTIEQRVFKVSNTSFYSLSDLAEIVGNLRFMSVGSDCQDEFNKYVNGLIGVLAKMGKSLKSEHSEDVSEGGFLSTTENAAKGENMTEEEKKVAEKKAAEDKAAELAAQQSNTEVVNATQMTEIVNGALVSFKDTILTAVKEVIAEQVKGTNTKFEEITNTVKTLTEKLAVTPVAQTVVTRDPKDEKIFNAAAHPNLSEEDKNALALINKTITPKVK